MLLSVDLFYDVTFTGWRNLCGPSSGIFRGTQNVVADKIIKLWCQQVVELVQDYMEVEANQNCQGVSRLIEFLRVSLNLQNKLSSFNFTILILDCCDNYGPELN